MKKVLLIILLLSSVTFGMGSQTTVGKDGSIRINLDWKAGEFSIITIHKDFNKRDSYVHNFNKNFGNEYIKSGDSVVRYFAGLMKEDCFILLSHPELPITITSYSDTGNIYKSSENSQYNLEVAEKVLLRDYGDLLVPISLN